jgi:hypothetical protein
MNRGEQVTLHVSAGRRMKYLMPFLLLTGLFVLWHSAGAQESRHFHALEPHPMPPREYSGEARFYRFSSRDIITAFKKNGLEVEELRPGLTVGAPYSRESTIFLIPSAGNKIGALVSSFTSDAALQRSVQYYAEMNGMTSSAPWRIFTRDNILLLISGKVPEKAAKEYERVLAAMDSQ